MRKLSFKEMIEYIMWFRCKYEIELKRVDEVNQPYSFDDVDIKRRYHSLCSILSNMLY